MDLSTLSLGYRYAVCAKTRLHQYVCFIDMVSRNIFDKVSRNIIDKRTGLPGVVNRIYCIYYVQFRNPHNLGIASHNSEF